MEQEIDLLLVLFKKIARDLRIEFISGIRGIENGLQNIETNDRKADFLINVIFFFFSLERFNDLFQLFQNPIKQIRSFQNNLRDKTKIRTVQ